MPYDSYRLYQIQRTKSPAERRRAEEQAGRIASALAAVFGAIIRPRRIATGGSPRLRQALPERW